MFASSAVIVRADLRAVPATSRDRVALERRVMYRRQDEKYRFIITAPPASCPASILPPPPPLSSAERAAIHFIATLTLAEVDFLAVTVA